MPCKWSNLILGVKSVLNVHESASLRRWRRQTTHLTPIPYLAECGRPMYPVHVTKNHGMALMDNLSKAYQVIPLHPLHPPSSMVTLSFASAINLSLCSFAQSCAFLSAATPSRKLSTESIIWKLHIIFVQ